MFLRTTVTKWRNSVGHNMIRGNTDVFLNTNRMTDIISLSVSESRMAFEDTVKDNRAETGLVECLSSVDDIIEAGDTPLPSKFISVDIFPKNNSSKVAIAIAIQASDVVYVKESSSGDGAWIYYGSDTGKMVLSLADITMDEFALLVGMAAPTGLTAVIGLTGIDLSWTDNSGIEDGFQIWVSEDGGAFYLLDAVGAGVNSYTDITTTGSLMAYKVRAYKGTDYSSFSNTASSEAFWSPPFKSDALFGLNGTIVTIGADSYFKDVINTRDFLITGYDFDATLDKGFPYKSAATISAPVGDAVLIAADINKFLYDAGGTPNAIPVVSLFQDIDYEHKLFCKHAAQVLDGNGVETYEPRVLEIVMYANVKADADLTTCQTYYDVPAEDATAKWVVPAPIGSDAAAGTKAAPWATFTKAFATENTGKVIYFKSGNYDKSSTSYNNNKPTGIGLVVINDSTTYSIAINNASVTLLKGIVTKGTGNYSSITLTATDLIVLKNLKITPTGGRGIASTLKEIHYVIFEGTTNNSYPSLQLVTAIDKTISDNLFSQSEQLGDIEIKTAAGIIDIKNNKFKSAPRSDAGSNILVSSPSGCVNIIGNHFQSTAALQTAFTSNGALGAAMAEIEFAYNTIIDYFYSYKLIDFPNHQLHTPYVHHNTMISYQGAGATWRGVGFHAGNARFEYNIIRHDTAISTVGDDIDQNILNGEIGAVTLSNQVNYNKIIVNRNAETHIIIGGSASCDGDDKITLIELIGNVIKGYGYFNATSGAASAIAVYWQKNPLIKYNNIYGCKYGIKIGHGVDNTANGIFYNLFQNSEIGIYNQKLNNIPVCNNTIVSTVNSAYGVYLEVGTSGVVIKNNIIVLLGTGNCCGVRVAGVGVDTVDYNIYYCPNGTLIFYENGVSKTFAQWQGLGYDAHSVVLDAAQYAALFNSDYTLKTGSVAIGAGATLDAAYDDGLDASTVWGADTVAPSVVTKQQGASWDIGAYIH